MTKHIFLPGVNLCKLNLCIDHEEWLDQWIEEADPQIVDGDVSSSMCLQAAISEIVLEGEVQRDWEKVFSDFLTDEDGLPLAYSEEFGKRLHNFENQWCQNPVHAYHTRWWINNLISGNGSNNSDSLQNHIHDSGWVYNSDISPTKLRLRMKSEFTMSLAMSLEMFDTEEIDSNQFIATLSNYPSTDYLSSEYFRTYGLSLFGKEHLAPVHIPDTIRKCEAGKGYCDFNVDDKRDDYMGTEKRTERDDAVHSPIATLHARFLANLGDEDLCDSVNRKAELFGKHLEKDPMDVPPFQIRDFPHPFGTGLSPLEVIAGSFLISLAN